MADCEHCKHVKFYPDDFMECKKDIWHELNEPCEEFDEYTSEDAYWEKYAYEETKKN